MLFLVLDVVFGAGHIENVFLEHLLVLLTEPSLMNLMGAAYIQESDQKILKSICCPDWQYYI